MWIIFSGVQGVIQGGHTSELSTAELREGVLFQLIASRLADVVPACRVPISVDPGLGPSHWTSGAFFSVTQPANVQERPEGLVPSLLAWGKR